MQTASSIGGGFQASAVPRAGAAFLGLFAAYLVLAYVGLKWALIDGAGSPVWPAAGVGLAGLMLGGVRLWPAIALARLAAALLTGSPQPLWADAAIALGNALATAAAAMTLVRLAPQDLGLRSLGGMLRFCFLASPVTAALSAAIGCAVLAMSSGLSGEVLWNVAFNWATGAYVGTVTIGPMILAWADKAEDYTLPRALGFLAVLALNGLAAYVIFTSTANEYLRTWQIFPLLIGAGLAYGVRGTASALVLVAAIAVWGTSEGQGPILQLGADARNQMFLLQQFLATVALTTLILSVVTEERRAKDMLAAQRDRLRLAEEQSRAQAEELQVILDAVPAMVVIAHDPDCADMSTNEVGKALLRRSRWSGDVADLNPNARMFDAAGRELPEEERPMRRAARGETIADFEGRLAFDENRAVHFLGGARPLFAADGSVRGAVGAFIDVTARKQAEDRATLLAMEVDHRAKNIMAVVQSVIRRSNAEDVAEFRKAVADRINNLARIHSLLAANRWDGASMAEVVRGEFAAFGSAGDNDLVRMSGPDLLLHPSLAQGLSMVIHELATNAVKYGALSVPEGFVDLAWQVAEGDGARRLAVTWTEENGPPVRAPAKTSFGTVAITGIVQHQLRGELRREWRPEGLVVAFSVPLED